MDIELRKSKYDTKASDDTENSEHDIEMPGIYRNTENHTRDDSINTVDSFQQFFDLAEANEQIEDKRAEIIHHAIEEKVLKDESLEAKRGRSIAAMRAAYGEFMASLFFYFAIFGSIVHSQLNDYSTSTTSLITALAGGLQAVGVVYAFSSVSGAHINSATSFALWLSGKLSNRRTIMYILVQLIASIMAMTIVAAIFIGNGVDFGQLCRVYPEDDHRLDKVFAKEFFLTFIMTYIGFTVAFEDAEIIKKDTMTFKTISDTKGLTVFATTPQSKAGFAPFSIGLTIFSLTLVGGNYGTFNPGRLFGPAVYSGNFEYIWLYWIGQLCGAAAASVVVGKMHRYGMSGDSRRVGLSAMDAVFRAIKAKGR